MQTETIKKYLEEAKKIAALPDEEVETINLELDEDVIRFIHDLAQEWNCTENDIVVAAIMAACHEDPKKIASLAANANLIAK